MGDVGSMNFKVNRPEMEAMPELGKFESVRDKGGYLKSPYRMGTPERLKQIKEGGAGYQAFQQRALGAPGESPWEKMMMERQGTQEAGMRDTAQRGGAQAGQSAWNQMAMRGGAGAGARERTAMMGAQAGQRGMQNVARQGTLDRQDIGLAGEEQRLGMLGKLPGMELDRQQYGTGLELGDRGIAMGDVESQRQREMADYLAKMKMYGAEKTARALENA